MQSQHLAHSFRKFRVQTNLTYLITNSETALVRTGIPIRAGILSCNHTPIQGEWYFHSFRTTVVYISLLGHSKLLHYVHNPVSSRLSPGGLGFKWTEVDARVHEKGDEKV